MKYAWNCSRVAERTASRSSVGHTSITTGPGSRPTAGIRRDIRRGGKGRYHSVGELEHDAVALDEGARKRHKREEVAR